MKEEKTAKTVQTRPPIVSVLGHVDHGKTTLLDTIRKTSVAAREAGGITQSIGASVITTKEGKEITFIDTPGHAAFANMRSQGANASDIAILVVAADDGVKPQTKEALDFIKEARIPFIVAATKTDLPSASIEKVYSDLEKEEILFEGRGGDTPLIPVSAKKSEGISEILEMIALVSEINEIKASPKGNLEAVVIETTLDKKGPLASVVVRSGILSVGQTLYFSDKETKIRGIFDHLGKPVKEILPGYPAQIIGFSALPVVGTVLTNTKENISSKVIEKKALDKKEGLPFWFKAANTGSLEALLTNLPEKILVAGSGVGDVNENDIFMAKAANAPIYLFESKASSSVKKLADTEGVAIETFDIIYKLFERLEDIIEKGTEKIKGEAEVLATFPFDNKKIAGSRIIKGNFQKGETINVIRGEQKLGEAKIITLRKLKSEVAELKQGEEGGILFVPQLGFEIGDKLISIVRN